MTTSEVQSQPCLDVTFGGGSSLHTDFLVDLGLVQVSDDLLDRVDRPVHLEVASDEELTAHFG